MIEKDLLELKCWAVVGATTNKEKYGYLIYDRLKTKGYNVYAVNPFYQEILGDKCYPSLSSLPEKPQVINMVVSPKNGKVFIEEAAKLGIKYIWFQPGTYDEETISLTKELGIEPVQACVLVATNLYV